MHKTILLFLIFIILPGFSEAGTAEDQRRIEEEKRQYLRPTEVEIFPEQQPEPGDAQPIELTYFKELLSRKVALNSDVCKVITILLGMENDVPEFSSQVASLKQRNIIPSKITAELSPNQPLSKGLAAYMFCQALNIKGGLLLRLFGMNQRYALKELVFQRIMSPGRVKDTVSGKELIVIFTRAIEYMTKDTDNIQSKDN
jgi:hypothetical protein